LHHHHHQQQQQQQQHYPLPPINEEKMFENRKLKRGWVFPPHIIIIFEYHKKDGLRSLLCVYDSPVGLRGGGGGEWIYVKMTWGWSWWWWE